MKIGIEGWRQNAILWVLLFWYSLARLLQLFPEKVPGLLLVVSHVVPPALFALIHGMRLYRSRAIWIFIALCLGIGSFFESISLRTGFPFGHYSFTDRMGPKAFQLPILLALAYVGMGYLSWVVSLVGLKYQNGPLSGRRLFTLPLVASFVMTAWDLTMDPVWANIDRAWVWKDGGTYLGVPVSNFLGWFFTAYCFYQLFTLYVRNRPVVYGASPQFWNLALLFYLTAAIGNLFVVVPASFGSMFMDATGRQWHYSTILWSSRLASIFLMAPLCIAAWLRGRQSPHPAQAGCPTSRF
ncbi:MAG TPA: carotenoid biosynthesis protein [Edaphobacter sp.]|nr:carotenoid biosynthesis protein [Edaphobacter sp.]